MLPCDSGWPLQVGDGNYTRWVLEKHSTQSIESAICACLRLDILMSLKARGRLAAVEIDKEQVHEALLLAFDLQAYAARGVGHTTEEGLSEALYNGFVAQLGRNGRTRRAATHVANFFGRSAFQMLGLDGGEGHAEGEQPSGEAAKNEL